MIINRSPRSSNSKNPNINDLEDSHSEEAYTNDTEADEGALFDIVGVDITNSENANRKSRMQALVEKKRAEKEKDALSGAENSTNDVKRKSELFQNILAYPQLFYLQFFNIVILTETYRRPGRKGGRKGRRRTLEVIVGTDKDEGNTNNVVQRTTTRRKRGDSNRKISPVAKVNESNGGQMSDSDHAMEYDIMAPGGKNRTPRVVLVEADTEQTYEEAAYEKLDEF